jgi:short-subunit dehydrogenase
LKTAWSASSNGQAEPKSVRVVLITGASAGIGAAVAREAARKGYALALTARRAERLEELAAECEKLGVKTLTIPAAIEDPETPERLVDAVLTRFGRLDVLVNNAGIGLPSLFADSDPDQVRRQVEVNFTAPLLLARHALPYLLERRGVLINIGSSITGIANSALGAYGPTKAGLAYFSSALRRELGHKGLSVCLVEPGPVKTEFFQSLTSLSPQPGHYHPMLDAPFPWMTGRVDVLARKIVALIERPRRRISYPNRTVWPWRLLGTLFQFCPAVGDAAVSSVVRFYERRDPRVSTRSRSQSHAAPLE